MKCGRKSQTGEDGGRHAVFIYGVDGWVGPREDPGRTIGHRSETDSGSSSMRHSLIRTDVQETCERHGVAVESEGKAGLRFAFTGALRAGASVAEVSTMT